MIKPILCLVMLLGVSSSIDSINLNFGFLQVIMRWDACVNELTTQSPLFDRGTDRLAAYLFEAQKNGFLHNENIDQISLSVIQWFYPNYGQKRAPTEGLLALIKRFKEEKAHIHPLILQQPGGGWTGKIPYHGLEIPTWQPWIMSSAEQFRTSPPPTDPAFWNKQLAIVKETMQKATEKQKERILFWAGVPTPMEGNWVVITNAYMQKKQVPLEKQIAIRDAIGKVIVDATIAVFDAKYTYLIKRPDMLDPELKTYIPTPNHPSFPSAHSTVSAAVVEILSNYLPENILEWEQLLEEAGMSRIWAGIHFPIDHAEGKALGKRVAHAYLKGLSSSFE